MTDLDQLESIYRSSPVVQNICVYADSTRVKPIAIILPVKTAVEQLLHTSKTTASHDMHTTEAHQLVLSQLQEHAREYDLPGLEVLEAVVLSPLEEWDVTNVSSTILSLRQDEDAILQC